MIARRMPRRKFWPRSPSRDPRLRVIQGAELPPGWAGKPHALFQGVNAARGEWLCFVDADTFVTPDCLAAVYAAAETHQADLFTIMTQQELGSFWEKAILPLVFTALSVGFSPRRVNDPAKPEAVANGQFIFLRRTVYEAWADMPRCTTASSRTKRWPNRSSAAATAW